MHDVYAISLIVIVMILACGSWVILNRFIALGYYIADIWKSKQPSQIIRTSGALPDLSEAKKHRSSKVEVEQLPLDVLAPRLKDPPRSPGGFGSRVSEDT